MEQKTMKNGNTVVWVIALALSILLVGMVLSGIPATVTGDTTSSPVLILTAALYLVTVGFTVFAVIHAVRASRRGTLQRHALGWVLLLAVGLLLLGQEAGSILMGALGGLLNLDDAGQFLLMYLAFIGIDVIMLVFCALTEPEIFRSFRRRAAGGMQGNTVKLFLLGLLVGFGTNAVCILAAWLHGDVVFSVGRFQVLYMLAALVCVCVQSGAEELVTRGYMFGALREKYGVWTALAANSLLFGALHLMNDHVTVLSILNIVLVGAALSLVAYCLDSLWMCIAIHTAWNFTQNFLFGLPNSGAVSKSSFLHLEAASDSLLYDAGFGVEGALPAALVMVLLGVCVLLWSRRKKSA